MLTERLELRPFSAEHLLALFDGEEQFLSEFGVPPAEGLRGYLASDEISPEWLARLRQSRGAEVWEHGFGVVHQDDSAVIGFLGFKGVPDAAGMVEVAYGIVPGYQGRGYATEAAAAGVAFALHSEGVRLVRAHTLPTPNASSRVLEKCGFAKVGAVEDPEDGPVWRWERRR